MKINSLLEGITSSSSPDNMTPSAPKFGRSDKFLEDEQIEETSAGATGSGSVATVAGSVGGMQRRGKGSIFSGIKTSEKFPNSKAVKEEQLDEISLGDYSKKAALSKAQLQMKAAFSNDPAERAKAAKKALKRWDGIDRASARHIQQGKKLRAQQDAQYNQALMDKYANVDIDSEIEKLQPQLQSAYNDYQYGARNTWRQGQDEYSALSAKIQELKKAKELLSNRDVDESVGKLAGITALGIGAGLAGNYYDQQQPKVEVGGQQAYLIQNPGWGRVPDTAMILKGKDGKTYKVWSPSRNNKTLYATPVDDVKEGVAEGSVQRVVIVGGPEMYVGKTGVLGTPQAHHAKPGYVLVNLDHGGGSTLLPKEYVKLQAQGVAEGSTTPKVTFAQSTPGSWAHIDILVNGVKQFVAAKTIGPGFWSIFDLEDENIGSGSNKSEIKSVVLDYLSKQGVAEDAPKGWEGTVKAMKKHKDIDNPWALAHYMKNKGYKSHKKEESISEAELSEEQLLARDLMHQLQLFKKAKDKELSNRPDDREVQQKVDELFNFGLKKPAAPVAKNSTPEQLPAKGQTWVYKGNYYTLRFVDPVYVLVDPKGKEMIRFDAPLRYIERHLSDKGFKPVNTNPDWYKV